MYFGGRIGIYRGDITKLIQDIQVWNWNLLKISLLLISGLTTDNFVAGSSTFEQILWAYSHRNGQEKHHNPENFRKGEKSSLSLKTNKKFQVSGENQPIETWYPEIRYHLGQVGIQKGSDFDIITQSDAIFSCTIYSVVNFESLPPEGQRWTKMSKTSLESLMGARWSKGCYLSSKVVPKDSFL